jgi:hypothetical protein
MSDLSEVSIGIKTLLRDAKLFNTISAIQRTMPEAKMIIADDGEMTEEKDGIYADLVKEGHTVIICPFDSGFGYKSNRIADSLDRRYLLIGSDDFDFNPPFVRKGIEMMLDVLKYAEPKVDIASGRVGQHGAYEFDLEDLGDTIIEHRVQIPEPPPWFVRCDLTVNYNLVRAEVLNDVRWDEGIPIGGGEHGALYTDVKRYGYKVAYVPGVYIEEQKGEDSSRYRQMRMRSNNKDRPCFTKRGIRKYILGNGRIDYQE